MQVFASSRFMNSNCNVVAFASAGATTLASFLATHAFRLADITYATTWGPVQTFSEIATLVNKFYITWVPWSFVDNCEKDMDTLGFEPRAFRMRSGCDTTTPCDLCTGLLDLIYLLFYWPGTRNRNTAYRAILPQKASQHTMPLQNKSLACLLALPIASVFFHFLSSLHWAKRSGTSLEII